MHDGVGDFFLMCFCQQEKVVSVCVPTKAEQNAHLNNFHHFHSVNNVETD